MGCTEQPGRTQPQICYTSSARQLAAGSRFPASIAVTFALSHRQCYHATMRY